MPLCSFKNCKYNHDTNCFASIGEREGCEFLHRVEVIRCRDCRYMATISAFDICEKSLDDITMDDFCSKAKYRKTIKE